MTLSDLIPGLQQWLRSLGEIWPGPLIKSTTGAFQLIQSVHLLALSALGGCVILMGLRLAGVGMTTVSLPSMHRSMRFLMWGSLGVLAITGVVMGLLLAPRLYERPAFLAKLIALVAALIMSFIVVAAIARNNGVVTRTVKIGAGVALVLWLWSIWVFGWSLGSAPGTFHVVAAGWILAMLFGSPRTRIVLGAVTAVGVIAFAYVTYGIYHPLEEYDLVMEIDRWSLRAAALLVAGVILWEIVASRPAPGPDGAVAQPMARLVGLFTILVWVTVAAAGRWIGLGGSQG
jgi:hypothetical protein